MGGVSGLLANSLEVGTGSGSGPAPSATLLGKLCGWDVLGRKEGQEGQEDHGGNKKREYCS